MNNATTATNVVLNPAISPSVWLIPSSLIILKNSIEGYNNKLKISDENMKFGINENLNYYGKTTSSVVKKINTSNIGIGLKKMETLRETTVKKQQQKKMTKKMKKLSPKHQCQQKHNHFVFCYVRWCFDC